MIKNYLYSDNYCFIELIESEDNECIYGRDFVYYADMSRTFISMSVSVGKYLAERFKRNVREGCNVLDRINKIRNKNNI